MSRWTFVLSALLVCVAGMGCCPVFVLPSPCSQPCCPDETCNDDGGNGSGGSARPLPTGMTAVQLVSEADVGARVTIRFLAEGTDPYVADIAISARARAEVAGPDDTTSIEAGGVYDNGDPLPAVTFTRDRDFGAGRMAVYTIRGTGPLPNAAPTIAVVRPAADETIAPGGPLRIAWTDDDPDDNAVIVAWLEPAGAPGNNIRLAPEIAEDPDGPGQDEITVVVPSDTPLGVYAVLLTISDGRASGAARSLGRVTVGTLPPVCPNTPSATAIEPASARRSTSARVTVRGSSFTLGSAVRLVRSGKPAIHGAQVFVAADGTSVACDIDLRGAEPGAWDVVVSVPYCADAVLPGGFTVTPSPNFDGDGDVDSDDFALLVACTNGPNQPFPSAIPGCAWADLDADGDVDGVDSLAFFACFNGPSRPPACAG